MSCYFEGCSATVKHNVLISDEDSGEEIAASVCDTHYGHLDALVDFVDA